jgi:ATP-dependent Clp protease protease subunit
MNLRYATNLSNNEYEILLHGVVGIDIIGVDVAKEMKFLSDNGATKITLRINSVGGFIKDGFSIVSAMLASSAEIHTMNEGTADSMALVVLSAGDPGKRCAYDYATGIIHDPLIDGVTLEDIEDSKLKEFMVKTKNQLVTIMSNGSDRTEEEIAAAMKEEKMLSASELLNFGLIDYVKTSKKQPKIKATASAMERMAACSDFIKKEEMDFKNEYEAVNAKFEAQTTALAEAKAAIVAKEEMVNKLNQKITDLEAENLTFKKEAVKMAVDSAIESGKFKEDARELLTKKAEASLVDFNEFVSLIQMPELKATDLIEGGKSVDENDRKTWDWEAWERNDPKGLQEMQFTDVDKYNKLEAADLRKYITN